ncbi:hypothetical protein TNCV_4074731 [Trichonephila clavipes]|nr:hypothetical protein TNCV_4074731 [Trichonephila clavipes]
MGNLFRFQFCATAHNSVNMTSVNRTKNNGIREEVPGPKAVVVYNCVMGGVDLFDQRKESYQIRSTDIPEEKGKDVLLASKKRSKGEKKEREKRKRDRERVEEEEEREERRAEKRKRKREKQRRERGREREEEREKAEKRERKERRERERVKERGERYDIKIHPSQIHVLKPLPLLAFGQVKEIH